MFSEESLDLVPKYTGGLPYLGQAIRRQEAEYNVKKGQTFDFRRAFWTPPLAPRQAYRLEERQIERRFGLPALVSLTDHDDWRAAVRMRVMDRFREAPISVEWTIPFGATFFHFGVHNLPVEQVRGLEQEMADCTANPSQQRVAAQLERLHALPEVLIVLNHPLWDEKGIGIAPHKEALAELLKAYGAWIHALEANGLRTWLENRAVARWARAADLPVVSGGDRHGREPNAILNLSRATSFAGFVAEVRRERRSHVVFMPQYGEPLKLRVLQTMADVVRYCPENEPGRRRWSDRIFYREEAGAEPVPLSLIWPDGGPAVVRQFVGAMQLAGWPGMRAALRVALANGRWSDASEDEAGRARFRGNPALEYLVRANVQEL